MFCKNLALVLFVVLLVAGCAQKDKPPAATPPAQTTAQATPPKPSLYAQWMSHLAKLFPKKKKPPVANPPQWAGTIRMVNAAERFVLIESSALSAIIPGEIYTVIGGGAETASLRMTALREPPFLIADIVSGSPSEGEKIYIPRVDALPSPTPAPTPKIRQKPTPPVANPQPATSSKPPASQTFR